MPTNNSNFIFSVPQTATYRVSYAVYPDNSQPPEDDWMVFGDHPPASIWRDESTEEEYNALMGHIHEAQEKVGIPRFRWDSQLRFDF